jgi:beta-lactamase regulating signal transducer with metallopeptidase domain
MSALAPAFTSSLAWALLDFVWQGALVGAVTALALAGMRRRSAQSRYAVCCAAVLLCAVLPLAGLIARLAAQSDGGAAPALMASSVIDYLPAVNTQQGVGDTLPALTQLQDSLQEHLPLVLMLWSAGAGALALRLSLGLVWVARRSAPGNSRPDLFWQGRCAALAARLGLDRPVRLGLVDDAPGPLTARWWRPVILLPAALASGMPVSLVEALLAHELAHIRRHDYLVNLAQSAIEIALFYHPAVWWLSRRIRSEREQVADAIAATVVDPRQLAEALAALDRFQLATTHHQLAHHAHGGNLMLRIQRLLRHTDEPLSWKSLVPALGLAAACVTFYASAQTVIKPPPPVPPVPPAPPAAPAFIAPPAPPAPPALAAPAAPAVPAAPAAPAAPAIPPRPDQMSRRHGSGEPYALVRPGRDGINGSTNSSDRQQLDAAKRAIPGQFLWFRQGGKAYVVRDPAVLGQVAQAWAPVDRLSEEMNGYSRQMDGYGKKMEALGHQMEQQARAGTAPHQRDMDTLSKQQAELGREMDRLGRQMEGADAARRAQLEKQMDALGARMGDLGERMGRQGAQMAKAQGPMEATSRQMEEAGKPMEALGAKMGELGERISLQANESERVTRGLIRDAMAKGLAQAAP